MAGGKCHVADIFVTFCHFTFQTVGGENGYCDERVITIATNEDDGVTGEEEGVGNAEDDDDYGGDDDDDDDDSDGDEVVDE